MSGDIAAGLAAYAQTQDPGALYEAVKNPPRGPKPDPSDWTSDPEPISGGPDFDDVTAAWTAGDLPDDVYRQAVAIAAGHGQ